VIKTISDKKQGIVFILWGAFAQSKAVLIDEKNTSSSNRPTPRLSLPTGASLAANLFQKLMKY
jgi:uracil DNA glycosylase